MFLLWLLYFLTSRGAQGEERVGGWMTGQGELHFFPRIKSVVYFSKQNAVFYMS